MIQNNNKKKTITTSAEKPIIGPVEITRPSVSRTNRANRVPIRKEDFPSKILLFP